MRLGDFGKRLSGRQTFGFCLTVLIAAAGLLFAACGGGGGGGDEAIPLNAPSAAIDTGTNNDAFSLKWTAVDGAGSYEVNIDGEPNLVAHNVTSYSLEMLTLEPRSYTLKVKAIARASDTEHSDSAYSTSVVCDVGEYVFSSEASGNNLAIKGLTDYGKTLKQVVIPAQIGGKNVTEISASAFASNITIESVVIPATVTSIGANAFNGNAALKDVVFKRGKADGVTTVGSNAFSGCDSQLKIYVPDGSSDDYSSQLTTGGFTGTATVQTAELVSLSVTTQPAKRNYIVGESFAPAGMAISAGYSDNTNKAITGYTVHLSNAGALVAADSRALTAQDIYVVVRYTEAGITKMIEVAITVTAPTPKTITVTGLNGKNGVKATVYIADSEGGSGGGGSEDLFTASGSAIISANGTLTVDMEDQNGDGWNGTGAYLVALEIVYGTDKDEDDMSDMYIYTNGAAFNEENIATYKYTFTSGNTASFTFDKFKFVDGYGVYEDYDSGAMAGDVFVRTITITGISGKNGHDAEIMVFSGSGEAGEFAYGDGIITGNTVTISLLAPCYDFEANKPIAIWNGTGPYWVQMATGTGGKENYVSSLYVYTNGQNINWDTVENNPNIVPKYNFTTGAASIPFNLFKEAPMFDDEGGGGSGGKG